MFFNDKNDSPRFAVTFMGSSVKEKIANRDRKYKV